MRDLYDADLTNANLSLSDLSYAFFYNTDLTNTEFSYANLSNATFSYTILTNANFDILFGQTQNGLMEYIYDSQPVMLMTDCELVPYAYCAGADLSHMNLSGMDLTGIDLRGANLQNTVFDYATLDYADLRNIVAFNATFIYSGMNNTYLQDSEFNRYSSSECGGYCGEANLANAHLADMPT